jgi:hypothetical protein
MILHFTNNIITSFHRKGKHLTRKFKEKYIHKHLKKCKEYGIITKIWFVGEEPAVYNAQGVAF